MFWMGAVYNFSALHASLQATPAMAASLTDQIWSVHDLLSLGGLKYPSKLLCSATQYEVANPQTPP